MSERKWRSKSIDKYDTLVFRVLRTLVKYHVAERKHAKSIVLYTISGLRKSLRQKRVLVRSRAPPKKKNSKKHCIFLYFSEVCSGTRSVPYRKTLDFFYRQIRGFWKKLVFYVSGAPWGALESAKSIKKTIKITIFASFGNCFLIEMSTTKNVIYHFFHENAKCRNLG